jgi:triacylglycerol lipase
MPMLHRRSLLALSLAAAGALAALGGCATAPPLEHPPIVFVHGNGDTAALWHTTMWRFESNGWPRERLHAIDLPYPLARDEDDKAQPGRSSTEDHMRLLATEVDRVLQTTGAQKVVLMASSRGANAVRNYVINGGGSLTVRAAVLGGGVNHGVYNDPAVRPTSEFNGASAFLRALNHPRGASDGAEVYGGIRWLTMRSDGNDKFAQPDGAWIGRAGWKTNVDAEAPALKGAVNAVLPALDHREVAFHPMAFGTAYTFITGQAPATIDIVPEERVVLDGKVSGLGLANDPTKGAFATNLPLVGATVEVFAVDPATGERRAALHRANVGADGRWGPLATDARTPLEFVVAAPGYATTHVYRSPFARSSAFVHLRAEVLAPADRDAASVVTLSRPRGYFGVPRDRVSLDGASPPPGIPSGVPGVSSAKAKLRDANRAVVGEFASGTGAGTERIVGRAWPAAENRVTTLELHY